MWNWIVKPESRITTLS